MLVYLLAGPAEAGQAEPAGLSEPLRLTAGASNQMMGSLSPDGRALYLVSDQDATREIFVQNPVDSGARLLFETNADVAWPQPSPDGRWLAYLDYRRDATGDTCLLELATGQRRCLTGPETSEVQVFWLDQGRALAVLRRAGMHADYQLVRLSLTADEAQPEVILERNLIGPALSPDGKWLAYVPLVKTAEQVGVAFSNRSGAQIELQRLDRPGKPVAFVPDLPGTTGFPAFSRDGKALFFTQYLNDTTGDGVIDGNDNSVLFRVDFDPGADRPLTGFPRQLSSARWNCRYPAPAADRLVLTCSHDGSLDIYSLPLTGAVPPAWDFDRVRGELKAARDHWTKLLLLGHLLTATRKPAERLPVLKQMAVLHLELREYESVSFYCGQIRRTAGEDSAPAAWARVVQVLAAHRRADVELTHGQLSEEYITAEAGRAEDLAGMALVDHPDVGGLRQVVISEIDGDVGRKAEGQKALEAVELDKLGDPLVIRLYAHRARKVMELAADRDGLVGLLQALSAHPALSPLARLHYAEELVRELVRGVPHEERLALIEARLAGVEPSCEAGLMLRVYRWLLRLGQMDQEHVRAGLFEIYKANKQADRRRALVLATVRMASRLGNEYLQYQFATSWASWLKRDDPERKYAEALYRKVVLERAYEELSKGRIGQARGYFYSTTMQTDSLQAHEGFIEAFEAEGKGDLDQIYERRFKRQPDSPVAAFVHAYRLARALPGPKPPDALPKAVDQALASLAKAARAWPRAYEVHHLWGYLLHRRYAQTKDAADAVSAYRHYLLALDLARQAPRTLAAVELSAGLLQASLGNHRLALAHLRRRERLPQVRPQAELAFRLALARSLFHVESPQAAVEQADAAQALIQAKPDLARFRPLALDRLALYSLAAGDPEGARKHYQALVDLLARDREATPINRLKAHLGLATAALAGGDHGSAVAQIGKAQEILDAGGSLRPKVAARADGRQDVGRYERADYALLLAGLEAQAQRAAGALAEAEQALTRRRALLAERFADADVDEDLLELARTDYQLAEVAYRQGQNQVARNHLERGLALSGTFNQRTGSGVNPVGLRLLQAYAELHLAEPTGPAPALLRKRLESAYDFICKNRSPTWAAERFVFELYLTMLDLEQPGS